VCLAASNVHGTTDEANEAKAVRPQALGAPVAVDIGARRLSPGAGRRSCSDKGTPTLTETAMGKHVNH